MENHPIWHFGCRPVFRPLRAAAVFTCAALILLSGLAGAADEDRWPRRIDTDRGELTIYQPQPESFSGNLLKGRAAASLRASRGAEPTFGVFWFMSRVNTDREAGTAVLRDIVVTDVRWPDSTPDEELSVAAFLTGLMPQTSVPISLDLLKASLATAEVEQRSLEGLKHDPPAIVVVEELAELLMYDGEPRAMAIPSNDDFEQVVNSSFAVVKDVARETYYLSGGHFWYAARDPLGPWTVTSEPPPDVAALVPPVEDGGAVPADAPAIVVATEPTELIATNGPPDWQPIGSADLLYIANSETPVLREVASGNVFVLLSGRWYRSAALEGPWTFVRPDQTPAAFRDIPPDSALGAVRVSVAETPEANDAVLDAQVPQTAAIERSKATLEVVYDGEPKFEAIEDTAVSYATNTAAQVLEIDGKYYACDNGVWFAADAATGPWIVADSVPMDEIRKIPPSSPVYNTSYVTIYESDPEVVYVGYTPGYMWSYPWYGVPIYGTGWYYPPYWGSIYYPRPVTWGIHVSYNPYTGWGMGFSYSFGFITVGIGFGGGYGGWYRPGYPPGIYHPPHYPPGGYRPPHYPPNHRPGSPRPTPYAGGSNRARASQQPVAASNIYNNARNSNRLAPSTNPASSRAQVVDRAARGSNNVYADGAGNVHRQTNQGWESRSQGQWQSPSTSRPAPSNLNRDAAARQYGAGRSMSRPMPRGGGGGFRR